MRYVVNVDVNVSVMLSLLFFTVKCINTICDSVESYCTRKELSKADM